MAGRSGADFCAVKDALPAFLDTLADQCRELQSGELTGLDRVLERKLYDIDRADIHRVTDGSDDGFLSARGFIVAMGRDFYDVVAAIRRSLYRAPKCEDIRYFFAHRVRGKPQDVASAAAAEFQRLTAGFLLHGVLRAGDARHAGQARHAGTRGPAASARPRG